MRMLGELSIIVTSESLCYVLNHPSHPGPPRRCARNGRSWFGTYAHARVRLDPGSRRRSHTLHTHAQTRQRGNGADEEDGSKVQVGE